MALANRIQASVRYLQRAVYILLLSNNGRMTSTFVGSVTDLLNF